MFEKLSDNLNRAKTKAEDSLEKSREQLTKTYGAVSEDIKARLEDPETVESWCSWCGNFTVHNKQVSRQVGRSTYCCNHCLFPTVSCRYCENMAKAASLDVKNSDMDEGKASGKLNKVFTDYWTNELCSEHDGTTPDFSKANLKIANFSEFSDLMTPKRKNIYGIAKSTATIAGGAAAIGTGAVFAAPGIAAALGTTGILGAATTGTAISSLSGAALTSAAVAKLGAGGLAIVSAAGVGLGSKAGFGIANSYLKDIPDFKFSQVRAPVTKRNHCVIVVNGLMSEQDVETYERKDDNWADIARDWLDGLNSTYDEIWHLNWEAKTRMKMAKWFTSGKDIAVTSTVAGSMGVASKNLATRFNAAGWAYGIAEYIANPWHSAMLNAEKTGVILAEAISRTEGQTFTLMGHSLGARVIFFALMALATKEKKYIDNAVLMGGAVGREDIESWSSADDAVTGAIYNCHSEQDGVLKVLYQGANLGLSKPAGLGPAVPIAVNIDCTDFVDSHMTWKDHLPTVLQRISETKT